MNNDKLYKPTTLLIWKVVIKGKPQKIKCQSDDFLWARRDRGWSCVYSNPVVLLWVLVFLFFHRVNIEEFRELFSICVCVGAKPASVVWCLALPATWDSICKPILRLRGRSDGQQEMQTPSAPPPIVPPDRLLILFCNHSSDTGLRGHFCIRLAFLNGLHLYHAFPTSGHSKHLTIIA